MSGDPVAHERRPPRMADLLVALSRLGDLGFGLEIGSAAKSAVLAVRLADAVGLGEAQVRAAFYTSLLHHVGCLGYAHESARLLGDDLRANVATRCPVSCAPSPGRRSTPAPLHGSRSPCFSWWGSSRRTTSARTPTRWQQHFRTRGIQLLAGQSHVANTSAPRMLGEAVTAFLRA